MNVRATFAFLIVAGLPSLYCATAQELRKKTQIVPSESAPDAGDSTSQELPVWEHQFFRTLGTVKMALDKLSTDRRDIEASSDTTLIKSERLKRASQEYLSAISGLPIRIHFTLSDVQPVKKLNRNRESVAIFLDDATFPYDSDTEAITVYCSPTEARQLQIGAIIRADGTLATPERRAFAELKFTDAFRNSFRFHISSLRVLDGKPLEEFRGFEMRYLQQFPRSPSTPNQRSTSASFIP